MEPSVTTPPLPNASDISQQDLHRMQTQLDSFLYAIRQHVAPISPSDRSDRSGWNDQPYRITPPTPKATLQSTEPSCHVVVEEPDMSDIVLTPQSTAPSLASHRDEEVKPCSVKSTVEVFRKAFETGDFEEVDAITSATFQIRSQYGRAKSLKSAGARTAASQSLKLYRGIREAQPALARTVSIKKKPELVVRIDSPIAVHVPVMPLTSSSLAKSQAERQQTFYEPEPLPSMSTLSATSQRRQIYDDFRYGSVASFRNAKTNSVRSSPATFRGSVSSTRRRRRRQATKSSVQFKIVKHGRHGKPKFKTIVVDIELGIISWGTGSILIRDVKQIRRGRQTAVLSRRYAAGTYEGVFASVVTEKRTLDLEFRTRKERNQAVNQIQSLITQFISDDSGKTLTWHRHENTSTPYFPDQMAKPSPNLPSRALTIVTSTVGKLLCMKREQSDSWTAEHF